MVPTNPGVPEQADIVSASSSGLEGPSGFRNEEKTAVPNESQVDEFNLLVVLRSYSPSAQTLKLAMPLTAHKVRQQSVVGGLLQTHPMTRSHMNSSFHLYRIHPQRNRSFRR